LNGEIGIHDVAGPGLIDIFFKKIRISSQKGNFSSEPYETPVDRQFSSS
jgi:hypothetical protein